VALPVDGGITATVSGPQRDGNTVRSLFRQ
jgi:hypothetical protein